MGSTFIILHHENYRAVWMMRSFDEAITYIVNEIDGENRQVVATLNEIMIPGYYLNLSEFTPEQLQILRLAADRAYIKLTDRLVTLSAQETPEPKITRYAIFTFTFNQLRMLIHLDPRIRDADLYDTRQILVNKTSIWEAPIWLHNFVLDSLSYWHSDLTEQKHLLFFLANELNRSGNCDLSSISDTDFCILLKSLHELAEYFASETGGRVAYGTTFTPVVSRKIKELYGLFSNDDRAPKCVEFSSS